MYLSIQTTDLILICESQIRPRFEITSNSNLCYALSTKNAIEVKFALNFTFSSLTAPQQINLRCIMLVHMAQSKYQRIHIQIE